MLLPETMVTWKIGNGRNGGQIGGQNGSRNVRQNEVELDVESDVARLKKRPKIFRHGTRDGF